MKKFKGVELLDVVGNHCNTFVFVDSDNPGNPGARYWAVCDTCHKTWPSGKSPAEAKANYEMTEGKPN